MTEKKEDLSVLSYGLGIISIVMAFFTPLAGIVFGIIGLVQSKKQKTPLEKKAKKLNIIGIVLGAVISTVYIAVSIYFGGINAAFPVA